MYFNILQGEHRLFYIYKKHTLHKNNIAYHLQLQNFFLQQKRNMDANRGSLQQYF
jgi:hypothetical protein